MLLVGRYFCSASVLKLQFMEIWLYDNNVNHVKRKRLHKTLLTFIALNINVDDDDVLNLE